MQLSQPIVICIALDFADALATNEGRIAHEHIETRLLATEHIREGQLPVQRLNTLVSLA